MSTGNIESAFPIPHDDSPGAYPAEPDMTLRDYAAIKAMAGMLSGHFSYYGHENYWRRDDIATAAYEMADAMLKARAANVAEGGE